MTSTSPARQIHRRSIFRVFHRVRFWLLLLCPIALAANAATPPGENFKLLDFWQIYSDAPNALYKGLTDEMFERLGERKQAVAQLRSRADWQQYRQETRAKILDLVGPFPEKTPLNARTLGVVKKDGFRLEKIVYESQPGLFVTAIVYVPDPLSAKAPAIVYCSGHIPASFRTPAYQHVILNLVKRGFIVLAFDPVNQGERLQFYNPETGQSEIAPSGLGHSHAGAPTFVLGSSLARLMIWDGIRGIDYLISREDVDPTRLGITGRSGGGTQTAYIAAIDERLAAAAPECYITSFELMLKSRGPQDAEQNFYNAIARGYDQADLLIARAPQPTLILATTRDIFSIEGTRATFAEVQRACEAFGDKTAIAMNVDDADHESTLKNREAMYAFFQRHLNLPGDATDIPSQLLTEEELRITKTGQLATSLGGETILSLNRKEAAQLGKALAERRRNQARHSAAVKADAARLAGYKPPTGIKEGIFSGRYWRDGYGVEKHLIPVDERYAIPLLAMVPESRKSSGVVLYLHPEGKAAASAKGGEMEWFVKQGYTVVAPDIIGTGELGPGFLSAPPHNEHGPFMQWYGFVLMGQSMVGRQMQDVMRTLGFIEKHFGVSPADVAGVSRGAFAPLLLHTAAIEGVCGKVALLEPMISYQSLVSSRRYPMANLHSAVPRALTAYDLPDLAACLAPRTLLLANARDGSGAPADAALIDQETSVIARAFSGAGKSNEFVVVQAKGEELNQALSTWID